MHCAFHPTGQFRGCDITTVGRAYFTFDNTPAFFAESWGRELGEFRLKDERCTGSLVTVRRSPVERSNDWLGTGTFDPDSAGVLFLSLGAGG